MTLELLDTTPDWDLFRRRFDNASRKVLRLRQKVVTPTLPTAAPPRWVVDPPDFNLDFHLRRVRVPEPGTLRQVMDIAEVAAQSPLDISRPLWTPPSSRRGEHPSGADGASQPRRHRRCRRCRDVRQLV